MTSAQNNTNAHHSTVELANCKLQLRPDLLFHLQEFHGAQCYLIEDEFNVRFYRVGMAEYQLISQLDGSVTMAQAVANSSAQLAGMALSQQDAVNICKWLLDTGLATTDASRTSGRLMESFEKSDRKRQIAKLNPVTPKFTLFNPDQLLTQLCSMVGWFFSFPIFLVWCAVVMTAVYQVFVNWELISSSPPILAPDNWIWLALTWMLLKVVHETAHGLACKRFDGEVRQCGVVLIVMIPLPFVDVTSSWRFSSKWQKILVAAAGMYVEILVAAIAAIVWCYSDIGVVRQHAFNVMIAGSITTVFFNANPLMRFDGYYMLADWLEMPNLGTHGQQWMKWVGKKYYLGQDVPQPNWPEGRQFIIATYAVLAFFWKVLICVGLVILAESLLFGAGVVLAMMAGVVWVIWPALKLLHMVFIGEETKQRPSRIRFVILTSALFAAGWFVATEVPWYSRVKAHAFVDYQTTFEIRAAVSGFIDEVCVSTGQKVEKGQVLVKLANPQLDSDVEKLKIEIELTEVRFRSLRASKRLPEADIEIANLRALEQKLTERLESQKRLEIVAPESGVVVGEGLESLTGSYLSRGEQLCKIESKSNKEVHAMVAQHDFELFESRVGDKIDVHVWGEGPGYFQASLSQLNPRGRTELPHPAFSAQAGGPLAVRYQTVDPNSKEQEMQVALVKPHFLARVELSPADSRRLKSGQPAMVSFRTSRGSVGEVVCEKLAIWIRTMREQSRAARTF